MTGQAAVERGRSVRLRPAAAGVIGRDRELAELTRALASSPTVVLVEGEAGIGKSRLLREYLASPAGRGHTALVACCPPFRQPHTLGPVTDALRQAAGGVAGLPLTNLAGALRPLFPEWARELPSAPEPAEDATAARHRLFRALDELIGCLNVAVLIVEDAHWADEATLEFLIYLASGEPRHLNLVLTYRPEDMSDGSLLTRLSGLLAGSGGQRLALSPLSVADTGALMSSMLAGDQVSAELAAFVHERTEGVPLAVEEFVRLLADRSDLARRDDGWVRRSLAKVVVPPTLRDAVLERAGRLSAPAQAVLRAAAVLASQADEALLTAVSTLPPGQARAGLTGALQSGLLVEDAHGLMSFRHALAGQAVYEAMTGPDRRELHLRAGTALERRPRVPEAALARHFRAAAENSRWYGHAERAAELAISSGDEATALILAADLITNAAPPDRWRAVALLDKITFASVIEPACYRDLERSLRTLLDDGAGGPSEAAAVRLHLARLLGHMEEYEAASAELRRALPHLRGDPARAARVMSMLGWPLDATTPASTHLRWVRRALQLALPLRPADRVPVLPLAATALLVLGEQEGWSAAAQFTDEAAGIRDTRELTHSHLNFGDLAMTWGRYAEARAHLDQALALAETHHYQRYREITLVTRAHLDWFTGTWAGLAERVGYLRDDLRMGVGNLEAALVTGLVHAAAGAAGRAEDRLGYVLAEQLRRGPSYFAMEPAAAMARLLLADGRIGPALDVTTELSAIIAAKRIWIWATDMAPARVEALIADHRTDEAAGLVTAFSRGLRGRDAPAPRAAVILCRAMLAEARGQHGYAASLFGRTAAAWRSLPRPYDALLAQERQAGCWRAAGDRDASATVLTGVFDGLSRLGAAGDAARVARTLRADAITVTREARGGRHGYGNRLSPRELDVARVLVTGGTNREIAKQLFLSPKTVARHLDSAMRKLGVCSRTALAVRLVEDGMITGDHHAHPNGSARAARPSARPLTGPPPRAGTRSRS